MILSYCKQLFFNFIYLILMKGFNCLTIMKITNKISNMKLSVQFALVLSFILIGNCLVLLSIFFYSSHLQAKMSEESTVNTLDIIRRSIDRELSDSSDFLTGVTFNKNIINYMSVFNSSGNKSISEKYDATVGLKTEVDNYMRYASYISAVQFYDSSGNIIAGNATSEQASVIKNNLHDFISSDISYNYTTNYYGKIIMTQKLFDNYSGRNLCVGFVSICLDTKKLISSLNLINSPLYEIVIFSQNEIVYNSSDLDCSAPLEKPCVVKLNDTKYYGASAKSNIMPFDYIIFNNYSNINLSIKKISILIIISILADILLFSLCIFLLSKTILLPFNNLYEQIMKHADSSELSLPKIINTNTKNEVFQLGLRCCTALYDINELQKKKLKTDAELLKTELEMLYFQINPHFLYNTLDTIYWLAVSCSDTRVPNMIKSLSDLFRIATNHDELIIPIEKEISILNTYLEIQRIRFADRINISILSDPSIDGFLVPKMILQPFVENTIKHIVEKFCCVTDIVVKIYKKHDKLRIEISDNGPELVENYYNPLLDGKSCGTGISNVLHRLSLTYDENFSIKYLMYNNSSFVTQIDIPLFPN